MPKKVVIHIERQKHTQTLNMDWTFYKFNNK